MSYFPAPEYRYRRGFPVEPDYRCEDCNDSFYGKAVICSVPVCNKPLCRLCAFTLLGEKEPYCRKHYVELLDREEAVNDLQISEGSEGRKEDPQNQPTQGASGVIAPGDMFLARCGDYCEVIIRVHVVTGEDAYCWKVVLWKNAPNAYVQIPLATLARMDRLVPRSPHDYGNDVLAERLQNALRNPARLDSPNPTGLTNPPAVDRKQTTIEAGRDASERMRIAERGAL